MSAQQTPSLDEILRLLNEATDKQALRWRETASEDAFRAQSSFGLVRIAKDPMTAQYALTVVDNQGTVLDQYEPASLTTGETTQLAFETLYKKARQQALNLDEKLKAFVDQLKALVESR